MSDDYAQAQQAARAQRQQEMQRLLQQKLEMEAQQQQQKAQPATSTVNKLVPTRKSSIESSALSSPILRPTTNISTLASFSTLSSPTAVATSTTNQQPQRQLPVQSNFAAMNTNSNLDENLAKPVVSQKSNSSNITPTTRVQQQSKQSPLPISANPILESRPSSLIPQPTAFISSTLSTKLNSSPPSHGVPTKSSKPPTRTVTSDLTTQQSGSESNSKNSESNAKHVPTRSISQMSVKPEEKRSSSVKKPRPASSIANLTSSPTSSLPATSAAITNPSGRATVSGHYTDERKSAAQSSIRARSASTNSHTRPKALGTTSTFSSGSTDDPAQMTDQQRAAYQLRLQFLGTRVYQPSTTKTTSVTTQPKPSRKLHDRTSSALGSNDAAASSTTNGPAGVTVPPVDPSSRFLAPTASSLQNAAAPPPTVDEILAAEAEAQRKLEAKLRAQRERAESAKRELAKYHAELAAKQARDAEEAAQREEEARQDELRKKAADRRRREIEKRKVEEFQREKQAREQAKALAEARTAEIEAAERKKAVEAYLKSKAQAQEEQESYERQRLQALEERIQQLMPTVNSTASATTAPIVPSPPVNPNFVFPTPILAVKTSPARPSPVSATTTAATSTVPNPSAIVKKPRKKWSISTTVPAATAATTNTPATTNTATKTTNHLFSPPRATRPPSTTFSPGSPLNSDSMSFFSTTSDVTQAFIAAQRAKERTNGQQIGTPKSHLAPSPSSVIGGQPAGTNTTSGSGTSYSTIHSSTTNPSTNKSTKSQPSPQRVSQSSLSPHSPVASLPALEAAIEEEFAGYDDLLPEMEGEQSNVDT